MNACWTLYIAIKEATGNINLKLRGSIRIEDKNLETITIKIQAKNRNKTTQGVTEIVGPGELNHGNLQL